MSLMIDMHKSSEWKKSHLDLPVLFVSGIDDPCTGKEAGLTDSIGTLNKAGYKNILNIVYDNARHEILNEKIAPDVIRDILQWIERVL